MPYFGDLVSRVWGLATVLWDRRKMQTNLGALCCTSRSYTQTQIQRDWGRKGIASRKNKKMAWWFAWDAPHSLDIWLLGLQWLGRQARFWGFKRLSPFLCFRLMVWYVNSQLLAVWPPCLPADPLTHYDSDGLLPSGTVSLHKPFLLE